MKLLRITFALAALAFASAGWGQVYTKFGPATGVLKGSTSTYQTTAAASTDIIGLWTGCTGSNFLRGDGTCQTPAGTAPSGAANLVYATPNGSSGSATLRALVAADQAPVNLGSTANGGVLSTSILLGTNGGTSNGFMSFTGPATALKTFTLPNASANILTDNALVTVAQGGTGAGTLTGLIKGNGTSALSAATNANVISLWTGTCSSTTFLRGDGACTAVSGGAAAGANTNIQFNSSGAFAGDSGLTYAGAGGTVIHNVTANSALAFSQTNSSNGTAATTQVQQSNDLAHSVYIGIAGSGNTGVQWSGGPTGEQAFLGNSGAIPLVIGQNNTAKVSLNNAVAGRQVDFLTNSATSTGVGYMGIVDQAGVRYGYFGKSSSTAVINYESDNAVALVANNGGSSFSIDSSNNATMPGTVSFSGPTFTLNGTGTASTTNGIALSTTNTVALFTGSLNTLECSFPNSLCKFNAATSVQAPRFTSLNTLTSVSCGNAVFCTMGTVSGPGSNHYGLAFCTIASANDSANFDAVAIVLANGSSTKMTIIQTAALMTLQMSGSNIQCKQSSGATNTIAYTFVQFY